MLTLGINAAFHDCSAAIVRDGQVLAAVEEERFTRIKHSKRPVPFTAWQLPWHAIDYCLGTAGAELADVDHIAYSFDPSLVIDEIAPTGHMELPLEPPLDWPGPGSAWDGLFLAHIMNAPGQLIDGVPLHLQKRFRSDSLQHVLDRWQFMEHHRCHEASAFLASPFDNAAVLTMDGRGEQTATSYGHLCGNSEYRRLLQVPLPNSLGLLYEDVTRHLGFLHSSDEYKVMALASSGKPVWADALRQILRYCGEGLYTIETCSMEQLFGPARAREEPLTAAHMDIACSLQHVLEETVLRMAGWLHAQTGSPNLCMAGGVALNCVLNAHLARHGPFRNLWVQPAAGDAGTALGAALLVDSEQGGTASRRWTMNHAYLGPDFSDDDIARSLRHAGVGYHELADVAATAADYLADEKIIGWFQGPMEFGPRALGARSILASPRDPAMQGRLNALKDREDFRPVAPVTLAERAHEWFAPNGETAVEAPFMLFTFDVLPEKAALIPAACHTDGSARLQTIKAGQNPLLHTLLRKFESRTGVPVLVNTSFNTRGQPMVCTPQQALESFWTSPLDALFIGNYLLKKPS